MYKCASLVLAPLLCLTTACSTTAPPAESRREEPAKAEEPAPYPLIVKASAKPAGQKELAVEVEIRNSGTTEVVFDTIMTDYFADGQTVFATLQSLENKDGDIETAFMYPGKEGVPHNPKLFWKLPPGLIQQLSSQVPKNSKFVVSSESHMMVGLMNDGKLLKRFGPFPIDVGH